MHGQQPLLLDLSPSKLKLCFLIALHGLAAISILFISDYGSAGVVLKLLLVVLLGASLGYYLHCHKDRVQVHLRSDNQVDLKIGDQDHSDLHLSGESYISAILVLLVLKDAQTGRSCRVMVLPDSMDAAMQSQLRARLKLASNHTNTALTN